MMYIPTSGTKELKNKIYLHLTLLNGKGPIYLHYLEGQTVLNILTTAEKTEMQQATSLGRRGL